MATRTKATTKKRSAPKGMTAVQQAEFDRAAAQAEVMKTIPAEFAAACELIPQVGMPYASAEERTKVAALIKRANAFAKEAGIAPESIDLVAQFNNYINHTTERKATMTTTKTTKGTTTTTRTNGAASTAITEAEIDAFVAKHEKDGGKMTKGAIVEAIRNSGAKIGYPGGDYLVTVLAKRTPAEKPAKATPAKAAVKPAAKAPKAAEKAVRAEGNLTRKTVTPLPKKAAKKSTAAAMRKPTTKATKALAELLP